jgi:hypothetical protein
MAIRYMWSPIDSPWLMPKRRQPSRLVVLRRSIMWKKAIGESVEVSGRWGISLRTGGVVSKEDISKLKPGMPYQSRESSGHFLQRRA